MTRFINLIIFLLAVFFLIMILSATWIFVPLDTVNPTEKTLNIPYEYNSTRIRYLLEEEGIIRPGNVIFQLMTRIMKIDGRLQSGEYKFNSSQNLLQIIDDSFSEYLNSQDKEDILNNLLGKFGLSTLFTTIFYRTLNIYIQRVLDNLKPHEFCGYYTS